MLKRPKELNSGDVVEKRRRGHVAKDLRKRGRVSLIVKRSEDTRKERTPFMRRVIFGRVSRSREG